METNRSVLEESIFGQTGVSNEVAATRFDKPPGWTGNSTAKVSKTGTGQNIGPNTLQKVMAGDMINATAQYYHQGTAGGNSSTMVNTVLTSLIQAITGSGGTGALVKGNTGSISTQLSGAGGFINAVQPNGAAPAGNAPQAFLTAIFFDERFNMIPAADGGVVQQQVAATVSGTGGNLVLSPTNYKAPKNGYVYIYLSNQSNDYVYWDNFQVGITQGNIAEENHYYAYGLKIATLSSKKLGDVYQGSLKNNYLYQGAYSELDEDIGWNDFMLRNYDAQIGRWVQQDPFQEFASPYIGIGGDPINFTDPTGGFIGGLHCPGTSALAIFFDNALYALSKAGPALSKISIALSITKTATFIENSIRVSGIINGQIATMGVGGGDPGPEKGKGFWYNMAKGAKDGGIDTWEFVKSLKTLDGWERLLHGINNLLPVGVASPERMEFYANTGEALLKKLQQIPDMTIDDWGYALGYGSEKVIEILLTNKAAATMRAKTVAVAVKTEAKVAAAVETGFKVEGQLAQIFGDKKLFSNWLKGNLSLSRVGSPLNATEAQQIINNAKKLGLPIESNLKGLQGLEKTGQWGGVPHFKVGNVHIPIEKGLDGTLKF
jgi:RHS repeat-associated protein